MKKIVLFLCFCMVSILANTMETIDTKVQKIATVLMDKMQKEHIDRVAVGNFQTNGVKSMFERYIENEIVNAIVSKRPSAVQVIERRRLSEVLQEQKLGSMGLLDKETRSAIGKILGAGAIISGETIVTSKEAKVDIRLYAVKTGRILAAKSLVLTRDETIDELMTEPVMQTAQSPILKKHTATTKYTNRAKQSIDYILVTVKEVKRVEDQIHITLRFASTRRDKGASVAIYAEGSDNIADFWKFFPRPKLVTLSDEYGNSYRFKSTTMKYAKTVHDWTTIQPNGEQIVQFVFTKGRGANIGKHFTFTILIRTATAGRNGKARLSSATLYLDGLVVN